MNFSIWFPEAAELVLSQQSGEASSVSFSVCATPTVACYEEVGADLSISTVSIHECSGQAASKLGSAAEPLMLRDQSRADSTICQSEIPNDTLSLSFRNVFSSTPRSIPLQRETLLPLNLSIVDEEESPLDLSIHSIDKDLDAPLNLVVKPVTTNEASTRTSARSMFQTPLNLASGRKAVENFTGEQPKTHAEHHFQSEPESSNARRSMSESNLKLHDTVPLEVKTADLANHLSEGKPLLNVLGGDSSGSKAEPPVTKRQCRETEQTGNNDYDEDSDDDGEGEAKLLNDFSIMEYFEPYRIEAVNFEYDCEDEPGILYFML